MSSWDEGKGGRIRAIRELARGLRKYFNTEAQGGNNFKESKQSAVSNAVGLGNACLLRVYALVGEIRECRTTLELRKCMVTAM